MNLRVRPLSSQFTILETFVPDSICMGQNKTHTWNYYMYKNKVYAYQIEYNRRYIEYHLVKVELHRNTGLQTIRLDYYT